MVYSQLNNINVNYNLPVKKYHKHQNKTYEYSVGFILIGPKKGSDHLYFPWFRIKTHTTSAYTRSHHVCFKIFKIVVIVENRHSFNFASNITLILSFWTK